jgi:hypothetical protein
LYVGPDEANLIIETSDNQYLDCETEGECCSESWWADIVGVKQLIGAQVSKIEQVDLDIPDCDKRTRQESDEIYCFKVITDKGECELIFRNSSNGYYGGYCSFKFIDEIPNDFIEITEDWQA